MSSHSAKVRSKNASDRRQRYAPPPNGLFRFERLAERINRLGYRRIRPTFALTQSKACPPRGRGAIAAESVQPLSAARTSVRDQPFQFAAFEQAFSSAGWVFSQAVIDRVSDVDILPFMQEQ